jgi:hypothetical protein
LYNIYSIDHNEISFHDHYWHGPYDGDDDYKEIVFVVVVVDDDDDMS